MVCLQQLAFLLPTLLPTRWQQSVSTARRRRRRRRGSQHAVKRACCLLTSSPSFLFPVLQISPLRLRPSFSTPANSSPANSAIPFERQRRRVHISQKGGVGSIFVARSKLKTKIDGSAQNCTHVGYTVELTNAFSRLCVSV